MAVFDAYVAVDWSAKSAPGSGADSIWIAVLDRRHVGSIGLTNPTTRAAAAASLRAALDERSDLRTLVGIDVGLGYPAGAAALLGIDAARTPAWAATWRTLASLVVDDERNRNNRFEAAAELNRRSGAAEGPFWGRPHGRVLPGLAPTKPASRLLAEFRETELALRAAGRAPKSMWQLAGAGSVGGQSLTAIPVLHRLVDELAGRVEVWPFTTGLRVPDVAPGRVVVAEVWPTMFDPPYPPGTVRDAAQVVHVVRSCAAADRSGELAAWCTPDVAGDARGRVVGEEGWVLGPPTTRPADDPCGAPRDRA